MNTKKQIILFWGICLITAFVIIWVFIVPLFGTIRQISIGLAGVKKELIIIHEKTGEIDEAESVCDKIDPDLQKIENLFVDKDVPVKAIEFLENIAVASDLPIEIYPISLSDYEDEIWDFVSFRLSARGSYINFRRFLEKMEAGPFLIEIYNLSVREISSNEDSLSNNVDTVLTIKVFTK